MKKPIDITSLRNDTVDEKPITVDWSDTRIAETWEVTEAVTCDTCGTVFVNRGGEQHSALDDESTCSGYVGEMSPPAMNYGYRLPEFEQLHDIDEAARAIANLPLCLVVFTDGPHDGETYLALTGGGMDLSWEICEAHILLGYLPPSHFKLPAMSGRGASVRDRAIATASIRSHEMLAEWAKRRATDTVEMLKQAAKAARKRARAAKKAG